ncbi:MAG TPA: hypothetical protein VMS17_18125 [Gemmataceae bacterium]|nr:hypothetical protein [Gemmataceae bacterium]
MSTVVQSTCPGCKQALRIPSNWLTQAVRCKKCGMVLQSRAAASAYASRSAAIRPAVSSRTPPPPRAVPAPAAATTVVAQPAAVAPPVAVVAAPAHNSGSPFDLLDADASSPARPSRYRRARGSWWKGPLVALSVLVVASVVGFLCWPYIRDALKEPDQASVQSNPNGGDAPNPSPTGQAKPNEPPNGDLVVAPGSAPSPGDPRKQQYPRRALIISVHNYLYANPVHAGMAGASARNLTTFQEALNKGLYIPMNEIAQLSDAAKVQPRTPLKPVIQTTLTNFLDSSRDQDCILVFFIGHAVVIGDDTYLAPIEGELDNADTLIPLKWVYETMAACKARQKVLVMDVNRLNPGHGLERPNGGPMDPKEDAAFSKPPDGVEVWTACLAGQQSYELDDAPEGAFIDRIYTALSPAKNERGLAGIIQTPKDVMPIKQLADVVNASLKGEVSPYKLEQQSRLSGFEKDAAYNPELAKVPAPNALDSLAAAPASADRKEIQSILDEIGVPPINASNEDSSIHLESLPPFAADKMAAYTADGDKTDLRMAVLKARQVIWALNTASPPAAIKDGVVEIQKQLAVNLSILKDGFKKPGDEASFKKMLENDERKVADMMEKCDEALIKLKAAGEKRDTETKRWQVNYDFVLARLEAQSAYLWEYQSMLGQLRKQMPDLAPGQNGWKLAAVEKPKGDSQGKNLEKAARKLLDQIAKDNPGTPWEVLAKRQKLTALGLQWQGAKIE